MTSLATCPHVTDAEREAYLCGHHNGQVSLLEVLRGAIVYDACRLARERGDRFPAASSELTPLQKAMVEEVLGLISTCEAFHRLCVSSRAAAELNERGVVNDPYTPLGATVDGAVIEIFSIEQAAA